MVHWYKLSKLICQNKDDVFDKFNTTSISHLLITMSGHNGKNAKA